MIAFAQKYPQKILGPLLGHLELTGTALAISLLLAAVIALAAIRSKTLSQLVVGAMGAVYAIPSLALFALLIPFLGLGQKTAVTVLVAYNQFILVRNILAGFQSIDPAVVESARGMGMSRLQILFRIELPLASPAILAGMRIAAVSTIGIATIAATINAGGLGQILFDGLRTRNTVKILWGVVLSASMTLAANGLFAWLEKRARQYVIGKGDAG